MSQVFCHFCNDKFAMSCNKTALPQMWEYQYDHCQTCNILPPTFSLACPSLLPSNNYSVCTWLLFCCF